MFLNHSKTNITESVPSKINGSVGVGISFGKKALFAAGIAQSGGEYSFMWKSVATAVAKRDLCPKNCLMLGVASGTAITQLRQVYPEISFTGVELDPIVMKIAQKDFGLVEDKNTKLILADAFSWVKRDGGHYDVIIVDLYVGDLNPPRARQQPFLADVKNHLKPNGFVLFNCHFQKSKKEEYEDILSEVLAVFPQKEELFSYPKNKILLLR